MSCGGAAQPMRASSICRRTGCRGSSLMRCEPPGPSRPKARRHWSRPTDHGVDAAGEDSMEMQDQSVIVTGGASGIGKATALLLAREGARVFIGDVDEAGGQAAAAGGGAERLSIEYLPLELTDPSSIADFAAAVNQRTGRVDGLVNGAGWDQIQPF